MLLLTYSSDARFLLILTLLLVHCTYYIQGQVTCQGNKLCVTQKCKVEVIQNTKYLQNCGI